MRRTLARITIAVAAFAALLGTAPQPQPAAGDDATSSPVFVAARSLFERGKPLQELEFAIWSDGVFIRRSSFARPDSRLLVCQAAPGEFEKFMERIAEAGFFEQPVGGGWGPDQSHTRLQARRDGEVVKYQWTEALWPGNPIREEFLSMWTGVRAAMLRIQPAKIEWLEESLDEQGQFRGYMPRRPERTEWLP